MLPTKCKRYELSFGYAPNGNLLEKRVFDANSHNLVGRRYQIMRVRDVFGIQDKKTAGALTNPLHQPLVASALDERLDAVERITGAAAGGVVGGFGPFVNHRSGKAEVGGNFFRGGFFEDFAQQFVGLHDETMAKLGKVGKREAAINLR